MGMSERQRPHVVVNMAMTADGKVDTMARRGARISSEADGRRVDRLRAQMDAVMVGARTLLAEDPRLTVRSAELVAERQRLGRPAQPTRVAVVSVLPNSGPASLGRFLRGTPARVIVFTTERTTPEGRRRFVEGGADVVVAGSERVDLAVALEHLAGLGVDRLLVEGGGTLVEALLRGRLVDEVQLYVAPMIVGGIDAPTPAEGDGFTIEAATRLALVDVTRGDEGGVLLRYVVDRGPHAREEQTR
jgi:2,5-diamino-6-(ribosylamino)-4(3H)-pyrimidinone 5'-phosphate reductase